MYTFRNPYLTKMMAPMLFLAISSGGCNEQTSLETTPSSTSTDVTHGKRMATDLKYRQAINGLSNAAEVGDMRAIKYWIDTEKADINGSDWTGNSPIGSAVKSNDQEVIEYMFLKRGAARTRERG